MGTKDRNRPREGPKLPPQHGIDPPPEASYEVPESTDVPRPSSNQHWAPSSLPPSRGAWRGSQVTLALAFAPACQIPCETLRTCKTGPEAGASALGGAAGASEQSGGLGSQAGGAEATGGKTASSSGGKPGGTGGDPANSGGQGSGENGGESWADCSELDCSADATCSLVDGQARCTCDDGYEPSGDSCRDIDECQDDPCNENAVCANEPGSYTCSCAPGFYEDLDQCWPDMVLVSAVGENLGMNLAASNPGISPDGRFVAFYGEAAGAGLPQSYAVPDVLFRDMRGGAIELLSTSPEGVDGNNRLDGSVPALSSMGSRVAFAGNASNLSPGDTNEASDVFVAQPGQSGAVIVSVSSAGTQGNAYSLRSTISDDGMKVAFDSGATNLILGDNNDEFDSFLHDFSTGKTTRASLASDGAEAAGSCLFPKISGDGHFLAFHCDARARLTDDDTDDFSDIYVKDLIDGGLRRASRSALVTQTNDGSCNEMFWLSSDGSFLAFASGATDFVANDTNGVDDVFVRNLVANTTQRVSVGLDGNEANGASLLGGGSAISEDGRFVVFQSDASNLVAGDTNGVGDVFLRDLVAGTTTRLSIGPAGEQGDAASWNQAISRDGRFVVFDSTATTFGAETNGLSQIWYKRILP